jgi:hypothetical protein
MAGELIGTLEGTGIHGLAVTVDRDGTVTVWASAPVALKDGDKLADLACLAREASAARRRPFLGREARDDA